MSRRYFHPEPKDLERCIAAWLRHDALPQQPAQRLCRAYLVDGRRLCIELQNNAGVLATFSVTPKRVTRLSTAE